MDNNLIKELLKMSNRQTSPEQEIFNPYNNPRKSQQKCLHCWEDGSTAIITNEKGTQMCSICKKIFRR